MLTTRYLAKSRTPAPLPEEAQKWQNIRSPLQGAVVAITDDQYFRVRIQLGTLLMDTTEEILSFIPEPYMRSPQEERHFRSRALQHYVGAYSDRVRETHTYMDNALLEQNRNCPWKQPTLRKLLRAAVNGIALSKKTREEANQYSLAQHVQAKVRANAQVQGTPEWHAFNKFVEQEKRREIIGEVEASFIADIRNHLAYMFYEHELSTEQKQSLYEYLGEEAARTWTLYVPEFALTTSLIDLTFVHRHGLTHVPTETFVAQAARVDYAYTSAR